IWLTPLLQLTDVTEALARATAPTLLVGGGADESWDGAVAERLPGERLVIDGADHALEIAGDPYASLDALRRVTARVDGFVAALATL
ncbi:MAG TPA: hypothetical protein VFI37_16995, partial [Gaiellaceae bacterium]|nr:hypothetical protein [Gaiellaceae bacterium]